MKRHFLPATLLLFTGLLNFSLIAPALAVSAYQHWMRIADHATQKGDYQTALINYKRAREAGEYPVNAEVNQAVNTVLQARLRKLEKITPLYVKDIRIAEQAWLDGDYNTAIINYKRALKHRPGDYYASARIQQAHCLKTQKPATEFQFRKLCGLDL